MVSAELRSAPKNGYLGKFNKLAVKYLFKFLEVEKINLIYFKKKYNFTLL
jgi:hypothetical protein